MDERIRSETGFESVRTEPIDVDLRALLERSRLGLLRLFRALDRVGLAQDLPPELRELFELDADLAEALWVLDQRPGQFDMSAMVRDTVASLGAIPDALTAFFGLLNADEQSRLAACSNALRTTMVTAEAYQDIPGRDPAADPLHGCP
jgi:hypothetical protein